MSSKMDLGLGVSGGQRNAARNDGLHTQRHSVKRNKLKSLEQDIMNKDLHPVQNQKIFNKARHSMQPKHSLPLPMLNLRKGQRDMMNDSQLRTPNVQINVKRKSDFDEFSRNNAGSRIL